MVFFNDLGEEGCRNIGLVSLDMSAAYISKLKERLPNAKLAFDPFHVVALASNAIDEVRRDQVRQLCEREGKRILKSTRWLLLKGVENLRPGERMRLAEMSRVNHPLFRAYLLKETLRNLYSVPIEKAPGYLDGWLAWASRSQLKPFVRLARTLQEHRDGVLDAIKYGLSNGLMEGLNRKVRVLTYRGYGFHSAAAILALIFLCCSGIEIELPSDRRAPINPYAVGSKTAPRSSAKAASS